MKKRFIIGIAATALLAAPAMAADMPVKMPVKVPPPPPVSSWSGFYGGVNGGYGWGSASGDIVSSDPLTNVALTGALSFTPPFSSSFRQSGGIAGLQAATIGNFPATLLPGWRLISNTQMSAEASLMSPMTISQFSEPIFHSLWMLSADSIGLERSAAALDSWQHQTG